MMSFLCVNTDDTGKYVVACTEEGVYLSSDYGVTLSQIKVEAGPWRSCVVSNNGLFVAAIITAYVKYSIDGGLTWSSEFIGLVGGSIYFGVDITASKTCDYIYALLYSHLKLSTDFGDSFTLCDLPVIAWSAVATSYSGEYVTVVGEGSLIYVSNNYGSSFTGVETTRLWNVVALSGDGHVQVASVSGGFLYVSLDAGLTWTEKAVERNWNKISVSHTGQYIVASESNGRIYKSSDYGDSWTEIFASDQDWRGLKLTGDGRYIKACVYGGSLWSNKNIITGTPPFGSLGAGEYDIIVRDSVGAVDYKYGYLLGEDGQLRIDSVLLSHETAPDADDGILQIVIRGGIEPYQVSWAYEGSFYSDGTDLEFLSAGEYSVTITDGVDDFISDSFIIGEEGELTASVTTKQHVSDPLATDGSISIDVIGGTGNYTFSWRDGDNIEIGTEQNIDTLGIGTYSVIVSDEYDSFTISDIKIIAIGQTWTLALDVVADWRDSAISNEGMYQYVAANSGRVYRSDDYGVNWTDIAGTDKNHSTVAVSGNGQYVLIGFYGTNSVLISSDYGVSFSACTIGVIDSRRMHISSDGQYMYIVKSTGELMRSIDFGAGWSSVHSVSVGGSLSISTSDDASKAYVTDALGKVYRSLSYGAMSTWYEVLNVSSTGVDCLPDALTVVTCRTGNPYRSDDYGSSGTWTEVVTIPTSYSWKDIKISSDGKYILISTGNKLLINNNYGAGTWVFLEYPDIPALWGRSFTMSKDAVYCLLLDSNNAGTNGKVYRTDV